MMRIEDFPRPKNDNGRGVHWSTRLYHNVASPSLDYWIDQLVAMKIKWLKVLDDGGASSLELCQKLVAADIMPVVRLFLEPANPNNLGSRELDTVSRLVDVGAVYFESNNEPDLPAEWANHHLPNNWLNVVVDNFIRDADAVLGRGGYLALPAMGPGSKDNPIELVVHKGRRDLFENGCWLAIHNYTLNHPLDYPDDDVNQNGRPLTQEEFDHYARWAYSGLTYDEIQAQGISITPDDYGKYNRWAWDGRNMEMVNQLRASAKNPGNTIFDDPNCFRGWEAAGKMMFDALGFYVPVISTEGGPVVGWGDDKRYAKVNPSTQKDWQLEIMRFMQSQAPPWYFSCCTWLLASRPLGDFNPTWEQMSWFTHVWDQQFDLEGELPIIQALKDEPAMIRPELQAGSGSIHGTVVHGNGQPAADLPLRLLGQNRDLSTATGDDGTYRFDGLAAGEYSLRSGDQVLATGITLADGADASADVTLSPGQQSVLQGRVTDTAGAAQRGHEITVGTGEQQVTTVETGNDGRYRVDGLTPGSYWVITGDGSAAVAGIQLDGWNSRTVDLTVPAPAGFRYAVVTQRLLSAAETGNDRKFYGRVLDEVGQGLNGIQVEMAWVNPEPGTQFPRQITPKDAFKPAGNFEFLNSPGEFILRVAQGDWPSQEATGLKTVNVPGREGDPITYEVNFQLLPLGETTGTGNISGQITGGAGLGLTAWLEPAQGQSGRRSWAVVLPADGRYSFADLPAGDYHLELEGAGGIGTATLAAGASAVINHTVGPVGPTTGTVAGTLTTHQGDPAPDRRILLYREGTHVAEKATDASGTFRFPGLQPGTHRLDVGEVGTLAEGIAVMAGETVNVSLHLPEPTAGSTVSGTLTYSDGQPAGGLTVWTTGAAGEIFSTTSQADGHFVLNELPAGLYDLFLEHPQQGQLLLQGELSLDGHSTVVVSYDELPPAGPAKPLPAYFLFGSTADTGFLIDLAMPYLRDMGVTTGFSLEEAREAALVTIVGDESVVSAEDEQMLRNAGCQVQRLPGDPFGLAEALNL